MHFYSGGKRRKLMVRRERIICKSRQILRLFLIYAIIAIVLNPQSVLAKDEKPGRDISITTKEGRTFKGELIAVQDRKLIIGDHSLSSGIDIHIEQVAYIRIINKSKFLKGLGQGFLIGAVPGAVIGLLSGDDTGGFIRFTAGQKAIFLGLALGSITATVGGVIGAIAGIDESLDLTGISPIKEDRYLEGLASWARYGDSLPDDFTIFSPTDIRESYHREEADTLVLPAIQLVHDANRTAGYRPLKGFHLTVRAGYYNTSGIEELHDIMRNIGFTDSKLSSSSGFFGGGTTKLIDYPRTVEHPSLFVKEIKLEYTLQKNIAVGLAYTDLGTYGVSGRRAFRNVSYPEFGDSDTYITGFYKGDTYFLTVSYFPIPDAFLQRKSFKLTAGIGYGRSKMDFYASEWEYSYEYSDIYSTDDHKKFSNNAFGMLLSAELMHFFSNKWSVGVHADYKWVTAKSDRFSLNSYYSYWDAPHFQGGELRYEVSVVEIPKRTWNLGGFGYGINLGFHF
jgi:hypothetical protein